MLEPLRVRILGPLRVEGLALSALGSRKERSLLRALALGRGAPVSVDRLVDCLWPERPPAQPADQLGVLVSRLRRALGPQRVIRNDAGYALAADWVDLIVLDQLATEAERRLSEDQPAAAATAAKAGLSLVGGPLLADETGALWADEARISVDRTLARLRLVAAEASLATGDPFGAAGAAQTALDLDPYDEHALRLLMTAHVRAGRPASALAAYAKTRGVLLDALGASPSELTEVLHLAILRDELAPQGYAPAAPERGRSVLAGRDEEWRCLDRAHQRARAGVELVVVEGEAGMGKTAVLESWSKSVSSLGPVLWGRCDPVGALPLQAVLDALDGQLARVDEAGADKLRGLAGPVLGPLLQGHSGPPTAHDPLTAQAALFAGALQMCCRTAATGAAVLVIDDVHLADATTLAWLRYAARRPTSGPLLIVLARRPERMLSIPGATLVTLGPLDLAAVAEIVGAERAPMLLQRSGGNPLFLVELAGFEGDELPGSIVDAVAARFTPAGKAELTLRTAAVLGPEVDLDLLAGVLQQSAVKLLSDLEEGQRLMVLEERGTVFCFRHELVREALIGGTGASRRALAHREAARLLALRPHYDPLALAAHARQGGNLELAASALIEAAAVASARFDFAEAERLLDGSLDICPLATGYLARGRARLTRENFAGASADAKRALEMGGGAESLELASWAAYYRRDFEAARVLCAQAQSALTDVHGSLRLSVLALAGRIAHADGALDVAQQALEAAIGAAPTADRAGVAGVWLGWLVADRGEPERAEVLAERGESDASLTAHPFATAHRALLASYASALRGRAANALSLLDVVDREVDLRHLDHFLGRTANYRAWLLRNLLVDEEADELNVAAAEIAKGRGFREPQAQSALDLADGYLRRGELGAAAVALDLAASLGTGFAFSWKARLRRELLTARLALADGHPDQAEAQAGVIGAEASLIGAPRYAAMARALVARARAAAGHRLEADAVAPVLDQLAKYAAPEAWWLTGELARDLRADGWWSVAEQRVSEAAAGAGTRSEEFRLHAGRWLDKMRSSRRSA